MKHVFIPDEKTEAQRREIAAQGHTAHDKVIYSTSGIHGLRPAGEDDDRVPQGGWGARRGVGGCAAGAGAAAQPA